MGIMLSPASIILDRDVFHSTCLDSSVQGAGSRKREAAPAVLGVVSLIAMYQHTVNRKEKAHHCSMMCLT
jgi:hypothetical protein